MVKLNEVYHSIIRAILCDRERKQKQLCVYFEAVGDLRYCVFYVQHDSQ